MLSSLGQHSESESGAVCTGSELVQSDPGVLGRVSDHLLQHTGSGRTNLISLSVRTGMLFLVCPQRYVRLLFLNVHFLIIAVCLPLPLFCTKVPFGCQSVHGALAVEFCLPCCVLRLVHLDLRAQDAALLRAAHALHHQHVPSQVTISQRTLPPL